MSVNLATAYIELVPSARGFEGRLKSELGGADGAASAAGDSASGSFGRSFLSGIAGIAKAAALSLGAIGVGAAGFGIKIAAGNEQAQISFETMLGSAEKAGAFLDQLKAFAAATPFEFPELQTAASSLISIGVDASRVIPIMTTLGNVTSGMGTGSEGVKRATVALQQMSAAGRITAEDLNQLRDAGVPVFELLTAATGKTTEEVATMARTGKLGRQEMEQLFAALESGAGLERFNGLMEKQSQSLTGLISTMKDTVGQGLAGIMVPAVVAIKTQLPAINQAISDSIANAGPVLASSASRLVETLGALVPLVTPLLVSLGAIFSSALGGALPIVQRLTPAVTRFVEVLANKGLNGALDAILPALGAVLDALAPLLPIVAELGAAIIQGLAHGLTALLQAAVPVAAALAAGLGTVMQHLAETPLGDVLAALVPPLVGLVQAAGPLVDLLLVLAQQAISEIVSILPHAVDAFGQLVLAVLPLLPDLTRLAADILPAALASFRDLAPIALRLAEVAVPLIAAWGQIKLIWWDLLVRVLVPFLPVIEKLLLALLPLLEKVIVPMVTTLADWASALADTKVGVVLLGIAMAGVLFAKFALGLASLLLPGAGVLGMLAKLAYAMRFKAAIEATAGMGLTMSRFGTVLSQTVLGVNAMTIAQAALNVVMSPWFLIPLAIAAAAAALYILYRNVEPFRVAVDAVVDALRQAFGWVKELVGVMVGGDWSKAGQMVSDLGGAIVSGLANVGNLIRDKAAEWAAIAWEWVQTAVPMAAAKLGEIYVAIVQWYVGMLGRLVQLYATMAGAFWSWLAQVIPQVPGKLFTIIVAIERWYWGTAIPWLIRTYLSMAAAVWSWIGSAVAQAGSKLGELLGALVGWITGTAIPAAADAASGLASTVWGWVAETVPQLPGKLWYLYLALVDWWINTAIPAVAKAALGLIVAAWDWVKVAAPQAGEKLGALLGVIGTWFTDTALPAVGKAASALGGAVWAWIAETVPQIPGMLGQLLTGIRDWFLSAGPEVGSSMLGWITETVPKIPGMLWNIALAIGNWVLDTAVPFVVARVKELGHAFLGGWLGDVIKALPGLLWGMVVAWNSWLYGTAIPWALKSMLNLVGSFLGWITTAVAALPSALLGFITAFGVWVAETAVPWVLQKMLDLGIAFLFWVAGMIINVPYELGKFLIAFNVWVYTQAIPWVIEKMAGLAGAVLSFVWSAITSLPGTLWNLFWAIETFIYGTAIPWLIEKVIGLAGALLSFIGWAVTNLPGMFWNLLWGLDEFIFLTAIPWVRDKVLGLAGAILSFLVQAAIDLPANMWGLLNAIGDFIALTAVPWITEKVAAVGDALLSFFTGLPGRITDAAKDMFVGLVNAFLAAANWIYRTWNKLELKIPEAEFLGQKVGGFTLQMPQLNEVPYLEHFATGGVMRAGQPGLVGEAGPELWWPASAGTIVPNAALGVAAAPAAGLHIEHMEVTGQPEPARTAFAIRQELRWAALARVA